MADGILRDIVRTLSMASSLSLEAITWENTPFHFYTSVWIHQKAVTRVTAHVDVELTEAKHYHGSSDRSVNLGSGDCRNAWRSRKRIGHGQRGAGALIRLPAKNWNPLCVRIANRHLADRIPALSRVNSRESRQ